MKTKTSMLVAALVISAFSISAQELQPANRTTAAGRTPRADRGRVYDESNQYIVFKLWTGNDPLTEQEKTSLQYLRQNLAGKNVKVIDYQYKTAEDLEKILKENGIEGVTVSTDNGIHMKTEHSNYNTTAQKAIFIFEGKPAESKKPIMISSGDESMNGVKRFFKLRSFS